MEKEIYINNDGEIIGEVIPLDAKGVVEIFEEGEVRPLDETIKDKTAVEELEEAA